LTRRELLSRGLGAAATALVFPRVASGLGHALEVGGQSGHVEEDVALQAERWIRRSRRETAHGVVWPADPEKPESVRTDLYNGMPGVVLFYLELFHATTNQRALAEARAGADELIARLPEIEATGDCGLYTGLAGCAFVLEETYRASGDARYRAAVLRALDAIHKSAAKTGAGVEWTGESATNDIISGSAGIGLFLLAASRFTGESRHLELATAAGRRLVEVGIPGNGGTKWAVAPTVKNLYPNFSHGTAGVGYFLATLYRATGERAFLDGALSGATYLEAVANRDGGGFKVFHHEPGGEDLYYLSWCHGPAGASRLFYQLANATHDQRWLALVRRAAHATLTSGIPEQRTPGFWNNISQCCGNCGVGEYFLTLNSILPDPGYDEMIRRVAADTLARATPGGDGLKWIQAENRVQPDVLVAQTGFMQGAAGVGTFFLHLDAARRGGASRAIIWPDSPFI
jgi:lantibiotic modifying enzyme